MPNKTEAITYILEILRNTEELTAYVKPENINRAYTRARIEAPSITLQVLDLPSVPPLGYKESKKRREEITFQINILHIESLYDLDKITEIVRKTLLKSLNGLVALGEFERYDELMNAFVTSLRFRWFYEVED